GVGSLRKSTRTKGGGLGANFWRELAIFETSPVARLRWRSGLFGWPIPGSSGKCVPRVRSGKRHWFIQPVRTSPRGSQDLQLEECLIAETVGLTLHGLDLVVRAFQGTRGDGVVVVVEDPFPVGAHGLGELDEHANAG
ncbi:MAG TPA: hypothetical protein VNH11_00265, partial [Pirellulales bacterium]|nr:hypothetical protein [Pirellulales bacterium]